jgi:hypothetical protein
MAGFQCTARRGGCQCDGTCPGIGLRYRPQAIAEPTLGGRNELAVEVQPAWEGMRLGGDIGSLAAGLIP